jgi:hypothetical protein
LARVQASQQKAQKQLELAQAALAESNERLAKAQKQLEDESWSTGCINSSPRRARSRRPATKRRLLRPERASAAGGPIKRAEEAFGQEMIQMLDARLSAEAGRVAAT